MNAKLVLRLGVVFVVLAGMVSGAGYWWARGSVEEAGPAPTSPRAALDELRNGNLRFVQSRRTHSTDTQHDAELRLRTAKGQHPFAAILCCSDSRVCPEFIFDQRAGCIFEVRNAGNVVDEDVLASLEYAVEHLNVQLIVILAHKGCGAIEAVCEAGDKPLPDHLRALQEHMRGIHAQVIECGHRHDAEVVNVLALENAKQQAASVLQESAPVKAALRRAKVLMVYALYDMETGRVEFFDLP